MAVLLGADVGGTNGRVDSFSTYDPTTRLNHATFTVGDNFEADYGNLIAACHEAAGGEEIQALGLAVAGKVSRHRRFVTGAGNLTHWVGRSLVEQAEWELHCKVVLGNDAEAAGLAEALYGHGRKDFWFVIWGTGIGGCLVRWDEDAPVARPSELGHQILAPDAEEVECGCGRLGCLESLAGGRSLSRFGCEVEDIGFQQWDEVAEWMARGVYNTLVVQPTPLVVFGGGVATKQEWLLERVERSLRQKGIIEAPDLRLSVFREKAGTAGALALLANSRYE